MREVSLPHLQLLLQSYWLSGGAKASRWLYLPLLQAPYPLSKGLTSSYQNHGAVGQLLCWQNPGFQSPLGKPWLSSLPHGTPLPAWSTSGIYFRLSWPLSKDWVSSTMRMLFSTVDHMTMSGQKIVVIIALWKTNCFLRSTNICYFSLVPVLSAWCLVWQMLTDFR